MKSLWLGAVAAFSIGGFADAAIVFFTDEALFDQALTEAGKVSKGIEDFEQTLLAIDTTALFDDPLHINNLQGLFNPGDFIDNLTFQSNLDGPGVNGVNPRGVDGLALFNNPGVINVGLTPQTVGDSFDILSGPPTGGNHTALGMHVFNFFPAGLPPSPAEVRVFDKNEQQIGLTTIPVTNDGKFLGILATGGDTIGRVNIWDTAGTLAGVYDIQTYVIPAPGTLALLGLAGLMGTRRRRR